MKKLNIKLHKSYIYFYLLPTIVYSTYEREYDYFGIKPSKYIDIKFLKYYLTIKF